MRAAFATVDITPPVGTSMGSNFRDDAVSRGVHDRLNADIIAFEGNGENMVFIDLDWCEAGLDIIRPMKEEIARTAGVEYSRVCITMTHSHSGPDTYGYLSKYGILESTRAYIKEITKSIAGSVKEVLLKTEEVQIGIGKGHEDKLSFNRRLLLKDGKFINNWETLDNPDFSVEDLDRPEGPVDPDVYVIEICNKKGVIKALMINFTLHPAVLELLDWSFTKDFIWSMEEDLKKTYGSDIVIFFANGALGNINHINASDRTQEVRAWSEAERIGLRLGRDIKEIIKGVKIIAADELRVLFKIRDVPIRFISREEIEKAQKLWAECGGVIPELVDGCPGEWYAQSLLKMASGKKTEELEFHVVKIGDIVIATFPAEVFVEFGLEVKRRSPFPNTLIFGLANQSIGYVPTKHAFGNGGMEVTTSELSRLVPEAGDIFVDEVLHMIDMLKK